MTTPDATVVITTKDRKDELRGAIASALGQTARPRVLVIDDGSSDGTSDMVRAEFPGVRVDRVERSLGLIAQRNRGAAMAGTATIFSIDDDAAFPSARTVEQTLAEFDHPRVAAVAIPFVNVRQDSVVRQRAPGPGGVHVAGTFIGTAHALRRDVFLALGGYRAALFHQGEEDDFCARLYDAGYVVRLGRADPIHHFESPNRDRPRMTYYGQRNNVLYAWQNVPFPQVLAHLPGTIVNGLRYGARTRRTWLTLRGHGAAFVEILGGRAPRRPVRPATYRLLRRLRKAGAMPIEDVKRLLPPSPSH